MFVGSCFGRKHFSSIVNTHNLSAFFSLETNVILMPLQLLYKKHLIIF